MRYIFSSLLLSLTLLASSAQAQFVNTANFSALSNDLQIIIENGELPKNSINLSISKTDAKNNYVKISCVDNTILLSVSARQDEVASTFYYGLHKLGFLFPHPREQITPTTEQLFSHCGKSYRWMPSLKTRGFHLHTQHPSEWVHGFFMGNRKIAEETIRWMARNMQNFLQIQMIRFDEKKYRFFLKGLVQLAQKQGIKVSLSVSYALIQQKSYSLISFWASLTGFGAKSQLEKNLKKLLKDYSPASVTFELGTSEFTPTNFDRTLEWMNLSAEILEKNKTEMYVKVHSSVGQSSGDVKNFNFLPAKANPYVGVLPHTVMFYGLDDPEAPVYERENFADMKQFMIEQNKIRPTLYYPETSYYIGMDIDVPIFLTDYLIARFDDLKILRENKIPGQVNFTTGQELGYWLIDWSVALSAIYEYRNDPMIGLKLIGESPKVWKDIIDFQTKFFKEKQLIQAISAPNFMDEMWFMDRVHKRTLLRELEGDANTLAREIKFLKEATNSFPDIEKVKNPELKNLLQVTFLRIGHALNLRKAIAEPEKKQEYLDVAVRIRMQAQSHIDSVLASYNRYPEAKIFEKHENPTSYKHGYGYTAKTLHFWVRDERVVAEDRSSPFFMNIYSLWEILF